MRWDVTVTLTSTFNAAVEADDPMEAQAKVMLLTGEVPPNKVDINVEIEQGVR